MRKFTVKNGKLYVNGEFVPVSADTMDRVLRPVHDSIEREIPWELALTILRIERGHAIAQLGRELAA